MLVPVNQLPVEESERERPGRGRPRRSRVSPFDEIRGRDIEGIWQDEVRDFEARADQRARMPVYAINNMISHYYDLARNYQRLVNSGATIHNANGQPERVYNSATTYAMTNLRAQMRRIEEALQEGIFATDSGVIETVPPIRGLDRLPLRAVPNSLVQARFSPDPDFNQLRTDVTIR